MKKYFFRKTAPLILALLLLTFFFDVNSAFADACDDALVVCTQTCLGFPPGQEIARDNCISGCQANFTSCKGGATTGAESQGGDGQTSDPCKDFKPPPIQLQVPLGTISNVPNLGDYLQRVYQLTISIVGIVAIVMIMIGGVKWITAAGNQSKVQQAKDYIFTAVVGIALLLGSYTILRLINPQLTNLGINVPCKTALPGADTTTPPEEPREPVSRPLTAEEAAAEAAIFGAAPVAVLLLSQTETGRAALNEMRDAAATGIMVAEELPAALAETAEERFQDVKQVYENNVDAAFNLLGTSYNYWKRKLE